MSKERRRWFINGQIGGRNWVIEGNDEPTDEQIRSIVASYNLDEEDTIAYMIGHDVGRSEIKEAQAYAGSRKVSDE